MKSKSKTEIEISVVVPIYNEEKVVNELYERLKNAVTQLSMNYELIFVNDGSKDRSQIELLELSKIDTRVKYINFTRNFGHQIAVTAGLDNCKGKVVVIIDGDLQDPPELIPDMFKKYGEGYDVVYAKRKERKGESLFKKVTAKLFYRILQKITAINIPLDTGDYRLMNKKVVDYLRQMPEQNKFLRGQIAWLGFKSTEVLFIRDERKHGKTGYSFSKMLHFAMDAITGLSDKPLQFVTRIGFAFSLLSMVISFYALYSHFVLERTITGWTSLIISSMFIGGIQLISIGIIGEYISRINKNVLKRPMYIIGESNFIQHNSE